MIQQGNNVCIGVGGGGLGIGSYVAIKTAIQ